MFHDSATEYSQNYHDSRKHYTVFCFKVKAYVCPCSMSKGKHSTVVDQSVLLVQHNMFKDINFVLIKFNVDFRFKTKLYMSRSTSTNSNLNSNASSNHCINVISKLNNIDILIKLELIMNDKVKLIIIIIDW